RVRSDVLHSLGVAASHRPADHNEALEHFREAEATRRGLVGRRDANEADWHNLARTLSRAGTLYLEMGRFHEADGALWDSHRIRQKLLDDNPRSHKARFYLARSWNNFAVYQVRLGALETALHFYRQSEKLRRELHLKQPDNKEFTLELTGGL